MEGGDQRTNSDGAEKEEEGHGCADSTGGLSKNMLGLEGWVNDIRLHYISGVGVSGWFDVGVHADGLCEGQSRLVYAKMLPGSTNSSRKL